jgi:methionine-rich copper-binding protein CopC
VASWKVDQKNAMTKSNRNTALLAGGLARLFVLLAGCAALLSAHAVLKQSSPAAGAVVSGPDVAVHLRFNSRVDGKRSRLFLIDGANAGHALPAPTQPSPAELSSVAKGLQPGAYKIRWQVLASDGHITSGEIPFRVK